MKKIGELSGGQKVRISLCDLQIYNPHVIILDEPTNHLDIYAIESLKLALQTFSGAILMITHNIYLIDSLECMVYELDDGHLEETTLNEYI